MFFNHQPIETLHLHISTSLVETVEQSEASAWIEDNNIKPYQEFKEQLIKSCKTAAFKEAVNQIEEYIVNPEKFGDIDGHQRNPEEEFDKLKEEMESEEQDSQPEEPELEVKKKSSTPKVKPIKRSSSAGLKASAKKKSKRSLSRSYTDTEADKPSMLNHSFSKKSSLLHRPSNIMRPDTPPLDLENVSDTLLEKNIKASQMKFGFLGLGIMGSGIVKNLLNSGHKVLVWNRTAAKTASSSEAGAGAEAAAAAGGGSARSGSAAGSA
ncbi:hypothetical protein MSG28_009407 [Choristoneura fumiferana]|uniref:Uncharacterized protein n=1 Tax=Choristoneura fumiferana TaxID=7141 RepID=A0ACC0KX84_CHOFU|nr:hypothetical protein MSG28_009407 [Choristoneura fumiferana]